MKKQIIEQTGKWSIIEGGLGTSYSFYTRPSGASGFLQGEDAQVWADLYEEVKELHSYNGSIFYHMTWDECLDFLCLDYCN